MIKFINLTSHDVIIWNPAMGDQELVIKSSGEARMDSKLVRLDRVKDMDSGVDVPLIAFELDATYGLPDPRPGVMFIVSKAVRVANPTRLDLASPDVTADGAVFKDNRVHSVPGLVVNPR